MRSVGEDKSYADDLSMKRGIVSSRVALLLRSAEIKPLFIRFVVTNNISRHSDNLSRVHLGSWVFFPLWFFVPLLYQSRVTKSVILYIKLQLYVLETLLWKRIVYCLWQVEQLKCSHVQPEYVITTWTHHHHSIIYSFHPSSYYYSLVSIMVIITASVVIIMLLW